MESSQGSVLHDRLICGEKLNESEQQLLEAWYGEQDQAESRLLERNVLTTDMITLRAQLETAIRQLTVISQNINEVMLVNEELRADIRHLQAHLVPQLSRRAA